MKPRHLIFLLTTLTTLFANSAIHAEPIDVGSRLELMLDDHLIESLTNLSFRLHSPTPAERVVTFDAPWETPTIGYATFLKDGDSYRMYYTSYDVKPADAQADKVLCFAESKDGIHWEKPSLGLVKFRGSTDNNIVLGGSTANSFAPFIDTRPGVRDSERYKAVAGIPPHPYASSDGMHWRRLSEKPIVTDKDPRLSRFPVMHLGDPKNKRYKVLDTHNVAYWDAQEELYVYYFRVWINGDMRSFLRMTSRDLLEWPEMESVEFDHPITTLSQFYTPGILPYFRAPHLFLGFPMRHADRPMLSPSPLFRKYGVSETEFMFSRDGRYFHRYMEPFVRAGTDLRNWVKHNNAVQWGLLPLTEEIMSVYTLQHFWSTDSPAYMQRRVLRTDGFVSLSAPHSGGEFTSRPLTFSGSRLVVNFSTGVAGNVHVEVQDAKGKPLEGYTSKFYGDAIAHTVQWKGGGSDMSQLAGKPIRLRFSMNDTDLYSIQFRPGEK